MSCEWLLHAWILLLKLKKHSHLPLVPIHWAFCFTWKVVVTRRDLLQGLLCHLTTSHVCTYYFFHLLLWMTCLCSDQGQSYSFSSWLFPYLLQPQDLPQHLLLPSLSCILSVNLSPVFMWICEYVNVWICFCAEKIKRKTFLFSDFFLETTVPFFFCIHITNLSARARSLLNSAQAGGPLTSPLH